MALFDFDNEFLIKMHEIKNATQPDCNAPIY